MEKSSFNAAVSTPWVSGIRRSTATMLSLHPIFFPNFPLSSITTRKILTEILPAAGADAVVGVCAAPVEGESVAAGVAAASVGFEGITVIAALSVGRTAMPWVGNTKIGVGVGEGGAPHAVRTTKKVIAQSRRKIRLHISQLSYGKQEENAR